MLVAFLLINARWIWVYRRGQPFDIDEAGYLAIAMRDYFGFAHGGISGLFSAIWAPNSEAPLTPALAAIIFCFISPHVILGFAIPLGAAAATVVATYFLAVSLSSAYVGLLSAGFVFSCPLIITYSRSFHFSMPATFLATVALLAVLKSDRFRHFGWVAVFGVCCGLMPLARTMTIAFLPGMFLGALVFTLVEVKARTRRFIYYIASIFIAFLTAISWLEFNGRYVFSYLLSYGYGSHASEYGGAASAFGLAAWTVFVQALIYQVHLPTFIFFLLGLLSALLIAALALARKGLKPTLLAMASSKAVPILTYVAAAILALLSSQNIGSAFFAPVLPAVVVLVIFYSAQLSANRLYRAALTILITLLIIFDLLPALDLHSRLASPWMADVLGLGYVPVSDGRGTIQQYERAGGFVGKQINEPLNYAEGFAWLNLSDHIARMLETARTNKITAFGFRNYLFNANTVALQELANYGSETGFRQVDPIMTLNTVSGNLSWLINGDAASANILLTSNDPRQFLPIIDNNAMVAAAIQAGFYPFHTWLMPDGDDVILWRRKLK
jgi:hypothetical protein